MKTNYKALVSSVAGALVCTSAFAGAALEVPLSIDYGQQVAEGNMLTVRSSKSPSELIGCGVRYFSDGVGGTFAFGFCSAAYDVNEETFDGITCTTQNPGVVDALRSISDFSYIIFSWVDDGFGGAE
jgi:hypothetical protein